MEKAINTKQREECYTITSCSCPYCGEYHEFREDEEGLPENGEEITCISCKNIFLYDED